MLSQAFATPWASRYQQVGMQHAASACARGVDPLCTPKTSNTQSRVAMSAQGGDEDHSDAFLPLAGVATVGALMASRRARARGRPLRGLVAMAAKALKVKPKRKNKNAAAIESALAALQQLEGQQQQEAQQPQAQQQPMPAPAKAEKGQRDRQQKVGDPVPVAEFKSRSGAKANGKRGTSPPPTTMELKEPEDPMPELVLAEEDQHEIPEPKDTAPGPDTAEEDKHTPDVPAEEPPSEPASVVSEAMSEVQEETAPPESKPKDKADALLSALDGLDGLDFKTPAASERKPASDAEKPEVEAMLNQPPVKRSSEVPEETAPPESKPEDKAEVAERPALLSALDGLDQLAFQPTPARRPKPTSDPARPENVVQAMLNQFPVKRTVQQKKPQEKEAEEPLFADDKSTPFGIERDGDEDDDLMIARRRGEGDLVSFAMEKGDLEGMVQAGLKGVQVRLGGRLVIQDASWTVKTGDRLALVGANGCGKTTQLRVLLEDLVPDEGSVVTNRDGIKFSVLAQGFVDELDPERTLKEELLAAVPRENRIIKDLAAVQEKIEELGADSEEAAGYIPELTALQDEADALRVYDLDKRMASILDKVGFLPSDLEQPVGLFSGGWKVRIGLSKIFMTAPDVLLLDEPTNHLDLESVEWLEGFLGKQSLPIVLVSHDREFMDRVCNCVVETVEGMTYSYKGNYSDYIKQRDAKLETWHRKYELQEKQIKELQDFIKINRGKQAMAGARNKKIEELTKMMKSDKFLDPPPKYMRRIKFAFPEPPMERRGARKITTLASMEDVTHGYGEGTDSLLLKEAKLSVQKGDKLGIVGRNGAGKSTLLRLLLGEEKPSGGGDIMPAEERHTSYFTQHQADLLPAEMTAYEVVKEANQVLMKEEELLDIMKKFRFKGDRLKVKCQDLSGGEKARLAIVRMMLTPAKLLVFDEPTNHLDVPMKETLEYSIREFEGAVVVVSHDRWFLSHTCTNILAIEDGKVERYDGDFRYYMESNIELLKKIEKHYTRESAGIGPVPFSQNERRKKERGGLKKNRMKRLKQERKEMIAQVYRRRR